jgi:hypothetical protein
MAEPAARAATAERGLLGVELAKRPLEDAVGERVNVPAAYGLWVRVSAGPSRAELQALDLSPSLCDDTFPVVTGVGAGMLPARTRVWRGILPPFGRPAAPAWRG